MALSDTTTMLSSALGMCFQPSANDARHWTRRRYTAILGRIVQGLAARVKVPHVFFTLLLGIRILGQAGLKSACCKMWG
jgi:hypothetical protein